MDKLAANVRITGHVQGVAFRVWLRSRALARGLTGWVRNNPDGSVSAHLYGNKEDVEAMITECWDGPGAAAVTDVQSRIVPPANEPQDFRITG